MSQVGERIRELREKRGWSQREFTKRVGINYSVVNRIELGKRPVEDHELATIADVFGVTTDYLLGRTKDPHGYTSEAAKTENEEEINSTLLLKSMNTLKNTASSKCASLILRNGSIYRKKKLRK
jgi:transcriptional regulator with XRE-family HTH domain